MLKLVALATASKRSAALLIAFIPSPIFPDEAYIRRHALVLRSPSLLPAGFFKQQIGHDLSQPLIFLAQMRDLYFRIVPFWHILPIGRILRSRRFLAPSVKGHDT